MMHKNHIAVAIKAAGKILRDDNGQVKIPFGSEYSIIIKNLNSVRAAVTISIDGTNATEDVRLIVPANERIELERFIKGGNTEKGLKFKFIERTKKIEDGPRGVKEDDGLIRIEFEFERSYTPFTGTYKTLTSMVRGFDTGLRSKNTSYDTYTLGCASAVASANSVVPQSASDVAHAAVDIPKSEIGITVGGSLSTQSFQQTYGFNGDGQTDVIILSMLGEVGNQKVVEPVTVKTKIECPTCGTKNKHGSKFCQECGTGLQEV